MSNIKQLNTYDSLNIKSWNYKNIISNDKLNTYNFIKNKWALLTTITDDSYIWEFSNIRLYNNKMYIIGGSRPGGSSNRLITYDISNNTWDNLEPFPGSGRTMSACCIHNDVLYLHAGRSGASLGNYIYYNDLYAYNLITSEWSTMAPDSGDGIFALDMVGYGNYLYVYGGNRGSGGYSTTFPTSLRRYNINSNVWDTVSLIGSLSGRRSHRLTIHNDNLYIFGGTNSSGTTITGFVKVNLLTNEASSITPISDNNPLPRLEHNMFTYNDQIHVYGGRSPYDLWIYDPSTNSWSNIIDDNIPNLTIYSKADIFDNKLYFYNYVNSNKVEIWQYRLS